MIYDLGKKYNHNNKSTFSTILNTFLATISSMFVLSVSLLVIYLLIPVLKRYPITIIGILVIATLIISSIYRNMYFNRSGAHLRTYKLVNLILFIFVVIPSSVYFVQEVIGSLLEKYSKGIIVVKDQNLLTENSLFAVTKRYPYGLISTSNQTFSGIYLLIFLAVLCIIVIIALFLVRDKEGLYLSEDGKNYFEEYAFCMYGPITNVSKIDYEYLKKLKIASSNKIKEECRVFEVYTYGEYTKYFYLYIYDVIKEKKKKFTKKYVDQSEIFFYEIENFVNTLDNIDDFVLVDEKISSSNSFDVNTYISEITANDEKSELTQSDNSIVELVETVELSESDTENPVKQDQNTVDEDTASISKNTSEIEKKNESAKTNDEVQETKPESDEKSSKNSETFKFLGGNESIKSKISSLVDNFLGEQKDINEPETSDINEVAKDFINKNKEE